MIRYFYSNALKILKNPKFWYVRLCIYVFYWEKRPFVLYKNLSQDPSLTYGETPYAVWDIIKGYLNSNDRFIDIGSGRGIGIFYLASMVNAKFLGIEFIDEFVAIGNKIAQIADYQNIQFLQKDLRTYTLPSCDVVFIAGTCFDDDLMKKLCLDLNRIKPKYIFSISTPLIEYGLQDFHVEDTKVYMAWGETSLYILSQISEKSD